MSSIKNICGFLESFAPTRLAEDWDNVGLLAGDPDGPANKIMTCLTITPETAAEAIEMGADLIVSHHPLPFRAVKKITTEKTSSRMLWDLIRAGISIYSPHTGFDSAAEGINQSLAMRLQLSELQPIKVDPNDPDGLGSGRIGKLVSPTSLELFCTQVKITFQLDGLHVVGHNSSRVDHVALACGSGGSFLDAAIAADCDTFVTGEANFHTCLEASAQNVSLILLGHYASERFAVEQLAERLNEHFDAEVWASREESDPLSWV